MFHPKQSVGVLARKSEREINKRVCVWVGVCIRQREREGENDKERDRDILNQQRETKREKVCDISIRGIER